MKKNSLGLIPKLLISIATGVILGLSAPETFNRFVVTLSSMFGTFLKFIIPLMIVAFVTMGIADLKKAAGKLLGFTAIFSYISTIVMGCAAFFIAINIFPYFIDSSLLNGVSDSKIETLKPLFEFKIPPMLDVTSAIVFAFMFGICIGLLRRDQKHALYNAFSEFSSVIEVVLKKIVVPFLPLFICGTFVNMVVSKKIFTVVNTFWKVFLVVIATDTLFLFVIFLLAGAIAKKNPFAMMKNQIPGYLSALGTQSSAASIPVNLQCAKTNGVSEEMRNFVIPLCANIHMPGSIITIVCCTTSILLMHNMPIDAGAMVSFISTLAVVMMAAPGTPGGAIMSALPFLWVVGIPSDGALAGILVALHITQDSFGTACNVSGDGAIAIIVDKLRTKLIKE